MVQPPEGPAGPNLKPAGEGLPWEKLAALSPPYSSPATQARLAAGALGLIAAVATASIVVDVNYIAVLRDPDVVSGPADDAFNTAGGIEGIVSLVCIVTFLIWFYRAYSNLPALGFTPRYGRVWSVGSWFIPILNFFRPKQIANDIWRAGASDPAEPGQATRVPAFMHWWWAAFLIGGFVVRFADRLYDQSFYREEVETAVTLDALGQVGVIAGALLAIVFVQRATRLQDARAAALAGPEPGLGSVPARD